MSTTLPAAAARIGVPVGTPMSIPGWQDSHARDSQKGEVIGPLTGQMSPPWPERVGPVAGPGAPALAGADRAALGGASAGHGGQLGLALPLRGAQRADLVLER